MRIQAVVEITNRDVNMSTKAVRTSIALGKKSAKLCKDENDPKVFIILSTVANRTGTKFNVLGNINRVFDKFVDQGKCTIQFKNPPKTLMISKADKLQLKSFLSMLKKVLCAKSEEELEEISLTSAALNPASLSQVTKPKQKLIIREKKDYPITKNFPSSLEELRIQGINYKKLDSRIFNLSKLTILDLSDNVISNLPDSFEKLVHLKELHLSNNKLTSISPIFFHKISKNLCLLDLSKNQLPMISYLVSNLKNLVTLNLAENELKRLPATLGNIKHLKNLFLLGNKTLTVMPGSFLRLRLDNLTMSGECFTDDPSGLTLKDTSDSAPRLTDICLKNLYHKRAEIDEELLPRLLLEQWDTMQKCPCGNLCLWSSHVRGLVKTDPRRITQTFISDELTIGTTSFLRCETLFCSKKCIVLYKNQPLNLR